jgi:hypothetical protein
LKVAVVLVALAAAGLAACGGDGDRAQRSAATPTIHQPESAPAPTTGSVVAHTPGRKRKPAEVRAVSPPAASPGQAVEVTVHRGIKLAEVRRGVRQLLSHRAAPRAKPRKPKGHPLVAVSRPSSQEPAPARKNGSGLLERLAQGKSPLGK